MKASRHQGSGVLAAHENTAMSFADRLIRDWYTPRVTPLTAALATSSPLFRAARGAPTPPLSGRRVQQHHLPVPVVVIGNITVGGSGKTPLVIALAEELVDTRLAPGNRQPWLPCRNSGAASRRRRCRCRNAVGDEPLLLARTGLPVWIGADRPRAARALLAAHPECDVVVADDGLQHYALARDVEIAVVDASRGLGNGLPLPARAVARTTLPPARNRRRRAARRRSDGRIRPRICDDLRR